MSASQSFSTWPELRRIAKDLFTFDGSDAKVLREVDKVKREGLLDKVQKQEAGDDDALDAPVDMLFWCAASTGGHYVIGLNFGSRCVRDLFCTCPAAVKSGLCKHGMAALLWCLPLAEREAALHGTPPTGHRLGGGPQSPAVEATTIPPPPAPAPARDFALESTYFGHRRIPRSMLLPLGGQAAEEKKPVAKKEAAAPKPAAKRTKTAAPPASPPPPLPKVFMSGEEMLGGTDEELLAQCRVALAAAAAAGDPAAGESLATAASLPMQPSRGWWGPSPEAMEVEEDGCEEPEAVPASNPPAPPVAPAAPAAPPPVASPAPVPAAPIPSAADLKAKYSYANIF